MTNIDEQEVNFRAILELDNPESKAPDPTAEPAEVKKEMQQPSGKDEGRKSVKISRSVHRKLKLLSYWMDREALMDNPGISELIEQTLEYYLDSRYPEAKDFILKNL